MNVEVNPVWLDPDEYVGLLNEAFGGGWRRDAYNWYLARSFRGQSADILVLTNPALVAGVGINYRWVRLGSGVPIKVGILTAAWTQPDFRGRGALQQLACVARQRAMDQEAGLLIAFVTCANASRVSLRRNGWAEIPSWYLSMPARQQPGGSCATHVEDVRDAWCGEVREDPTHVKFYYATSAEWRSQFVDRPHPVVLLRSPAGEAILEGVDDTWRIQWLSSPESHWTALVDDLAVWSTRSSRGLFLYTTRGDVRDAAVRSGMVPTRGAISVVSASRRVLENALDTPIRRNPRHDPTRGFGAWSVDSGDRM